MSKKWRKASLIQAHTTPASFRICGAGEPLEMTAGVEATAEAPAKLPTFSMTAYTGVPMKLEGFYHPVVVDLATASAARQSVPVPRNHDPERIAGHTTGIEITAQRIRAEGVLSGENEFSAEVARTAKNGFPWQASIGASLGPKGKMDFVDRGESVKVNGRNWDGPVYVARGAVIREISIVPMGADGDTSSSIAASRKETDMKFEKWLQVRGYAATMTDQEKTLLRAAYEYEKKQAETPAVIPAPIPTTAIDTEKLKVELAAARQSELQAVRTDAAEEVKRHNKVREICAADPKLTFEVEESGQKKAVNIFEAALAEGWTPEKTELTVLRASRAKPVVPGGLGYVTTTPEVNDAVLEAAILQAGRCKLFESNYLDHQEERGCAVPADLRAQTKNEMSKYSDQVQQAAHTMFRGRVGLQKLLVIKARQNGYHGSDCIDDGNLRSILQFAFKPEIQADGFSTASISNVLSNVQNKQMLAGYFYTEMIWRMLTGIRSAKDFKATKNINLLSDTTFKPLAPDGKIEHASLQDQAFANQLATFAIMIAITRQMIINDDLSALSQIPMMIGRGWGLKINDMFWTKFLNMGKDDGGSTDFYAATHTITGQYGNSNYMSGGSSALSNTALTAAMVLWDNQVDPMNKPLTGESPKYLVFPTDLETTALELMQSERMISGNTTKAPDINRWRNRFTPAKSRYLNKTSIGGATVTGSTTAWWLLSEPDFLPTIEVAFLNGQETPVIQTGGVDAQFDSLGIQMRGFMDAGVEKQNFRGGIKSAGV